MILKACLRPLILLSRSSRWSHSCWASRIPATAHPSVMSAIMTKGSSSGKFMFLMMASSAPSSPAWMLVDGYTSSISSMVRSAGALSCMGSCGASITSDFDANPTMPKQSLSTCKPSTIFLMASFSAPSGPTNGDMLMLRSTHSTRPRGRCVGSSGRWPSRWTDTKNSPCFTPGVALPKGLSAMSILVPPADTLTWSDPRMSFCGASSTLRCTFLRIWGAVLVLNFLVGSAAGSSSLIWRLRGCLVIITRPGLIRERHSTSRSVRASSEQGPV
mmetsp:Transcript_4566/g.11490  ORF Transcript_4566/g.11490 Transcript_4566/m.11490 type:complete len:273 (-) Transcript_4566:596-1414(-)